MTEVIETRTKTIEQKIVSLQNIKDIAAFIELEYKKVNKKKNSHCTLSFSVECSDGSKLKSASSAIFDGNGPLSRKRVLSISVSYHDYKTQQKIDLSLDHGNSSYRNKLCIEGNDRHWVSGMYDQILGFIESWSPQNILYYKNKGLIEVFIALGLGYLFTLVIYSLVDWALIDITEGLPTPKDLPAPTPDAEPSRTHQFIKQLLDSPIAIFVKYLWYYLMGSLLSFSVTGKLQDLWPSIELNIGPEYTLKEKSYRQAMKAFVVLIIFPFLVNVVFSIYEIKIKTIDPVKLVKQDNNGGQVVSE